MWYYPTEDQWTWTHSDTTRTSSAILWSIKTQGRKNTIWPRSRIEHHKWGPLLDSIFTLFVLCWTYQETEDVLGCRCVLVFNVKHGCASSIAGICQRTHTRSKVDSIKSPRNNSIWQFLTPLSLLDDAHKMSQGRSIPLLGTLLSGLSPAKFECRQS